MFAPESIAVIGATEAPGSVGRALLKNLKSYRGPIYPVNLKRDRVLGLRAFPKIGAVPDHVDLAIIATPAATVPEVVQECAEAGVTGAIIVSAGFKECGSFGAKLASIMVKFHNLPTLSGNVSFSASLHTVFHRAYRVIEIEDNVAKFVKLVTASSPANIGR